MRHFQVTVKEIPNQYLKRLSYRETYTLTANNETEAKQSALDLFGDWSQIATCIEFDPEYPPETTYLECE
jgi:hypothetical protein